MNSSASARRSRSRTRPRRHALHAKAWLFERNSGYHTAYVGSSNLTHSALARWPRVERASNTLSTTRRSSIGSAPRLSSIGMSLSSSRTTREWTVSASRRRWTLQNRSRCHPTPYRLNIDVAAQAVPGRDARGARAANAQRGHFRNLVVAPTGTGKTWVSAFDYQRLRRGGLRAAALRRPPRTRSSSRARRSSASSSTTRFRRAVHWGRTARPLGARLRLDPVAQSRRSTNSIRRSSMSSSSTSSTTPRQTHTRGCSST